MNEALNFAAAAEELVAKIFESQNFSVEKAPFRERVYGPDLIARSQETSACIEVKAYRSLRISISAVQSSAVDLINWMNEFDCEWGVLVVFAAIPAAGIESIQRLDERLAIYDLSTLRFLSYVRNDLQSELQELVAENYPFSDQNSIEAIQPSKGPIRGLTISIGPAIIRIRGRELCKEIRAIPTGRRHFRDFERSCRAALMYAFEQDLTGWFEQKRTDAGMSVYDTVCRIVSEHDMWLMITNHFNSKYVVFEYKNYKNKIKQGQIYTTEKYLYKTALRTFAIIVSRNGADFNAEQACKGALREHGKLILNISVDDLCKMLHARDDKNDPSALLVEKLDNLLIQIDR